MTVTSSTSAQEPQHVGVAADHGGFELKQYLEARLREAGHRVNDFGDHRSNSDDDYPDYVIPLARAVARGDLDRGVAVCGSGVGACIAANKVAGVRACLIHEHFSAKQGVEDDNLNVLCLGGQVVGHESAWALVQTFLAARFSGAERHRRRLAKVAALEHADAKGSFIKISPLAGNTEATTASLAPPPHEQTEREAVEAWENEGDPN